MSQSASTLYLGGQPIWHNPEGLGHAWIRLRKDIYEQRLIETLKYYWRAEDRWEDDGGAALGIEVPAEEVRS